MQAFSLHKNAHRLAVIDGVKPNISSLFPFLDALINSAFGYHFSFYLGLVL